MTSAAQAASNAANAQASTGPRTEEGKARSSKNATKHGLTSRDLVIREDERKEFESLQSDLLAELTPEGTLETLTFNQILRASWDMMRFRRLESWLMANDIDPVLDDASAKTLDRLNRYATRAERSYYRAIHELRTLQTNRTLRYAKLTEEQREVVPAIVSINDLTKLSPAEVTAKAVEMATKMIDYEAATYASASFRKAPGGGR
jgi:hypothetical protein